MIKFDLLPWKWITLGVGVLALGASITAWYYKTENKNLLAEIKTVVTAIQIASDNKKVTWKSAAQQILALGDSNRSLKISIEKQNKSISDMMHESIQLKKDKKELEALVAKAQAQRAAAVKDLATRAKTPGSREDCKLLIKEAEEALDLAFELGI